MGDRNIIYMADSIDGERFAVHLFGGTAFCELEATLSSELWRLNTITAVIREYSIPPKEMVRILDAQLSDTRFDPCGLGEPEYGAGHIHYWAEFWRSGKERVVKHVNKILEAVGPKPN